LTQEQAKQQLFDADIRNKLQAQLDGLAYLWGTGPVPTDYARWVDRTLYLLKSSFGEESTVVAEFLEAVGEGGSSVAQRLPLQGPWGLWERMRSAEVILRGTLGGL
jgi:hypothetical protein